MTSASTSSAVANGFVIDWNEAGIRYARKYVGEDNTPQDIKRRRRQVYDAMRHMGSPVLVKHMYNADDFEKGKAVKSDNYDSVYGQTRHNDPLSHGIGFSSLELSENEWVMPDGSLTKSGDQPAGGKPAPKYRGFGPGYLIYMIQPDAAEDMFKVNETGALIKIQSATAQAPWFPEISDNDLIINVEIDGAGNILDTFERYQAKMVNPISMRGFGDRRGRREGTEDGGNRFIVNQQFEMTLVPDTDVLMQVDTDR